VGERLPSDRHSPLLNLSRLAKGFLGSAGLPFEERYRSYVQVFPVDEVQRLLRLEGARGPTGSRMRSVTPVAGIPSIACWSWTRKRSCPDDLLMLTDKMSMAVSLECRVPFLDHELVELAASMPSEVKIRGGRLKHVLKEAVASLLRATSSSARNAASARRWAPGSRRISRRWCGACCRNP